MVWSVRRKVRSDLEPSSPRDSSRSLPVPVTGRASSRATAACAVFFVSRAGRRPAGSGLSAARDERRQQRPETLARSSRGVSRHGLPQSRDQLGEGFWAKPEGDGSKVQMHDAAGAQLHGGDAAFCQADLATISGVSSPRAVRAAHHLGPLDQGDRGRHAVPRAPSSDPKTHTECDFHLQEGSAVVAGHFLRLEELVRTAFLVENDFH